MALFSDLSVTTVAPGGSVTITGAEFGSEQGASTVWLNQTPCTVTAWSDTSVTVTIPNDGNTGALYVKLQQELDCGALTVSNTAPATC